MSIIAPNSDITLYSNVPISDVKNIVFSSPTAQANYFASKVYRTAVECTYERVGDPLILEIPIEDMYEFNYISFKNKSFENKTIYARALQPVYVNNEVMAVPYVVDDWQTFMFDITMDKCGIVRETINKIDKERLSSETNKVFSHNILPMFTPEPLSFDPSIRANRVNTGIANSFFLQVMEGYPWGYEFGGGSENWYTPVACVVISQDVTADPEAIITSQAKFDSLSKFPDVTRKEFFSLSDNGRKALTQFIQWLCTRGMVSSILGIYYVPAMLADKIVTGSSDANAYTPVYQQLSYKPYKLINVGVNLDNEPKLNNYPYKYVRVSDFKGNAKEYRLDRFNGSFGSGDFTISFGLFASFNAYPQVIIAPRNYFGTKPYGASGFSPNDLPDGMGDVSEYNLNECIVINDFPQIAYNTDGFLTWLGGVYNQQIVKDATAAPWAYNKYIESAGILLQSIGGLIGNAAQYNVGGAVESATTGMYGNIFNKQMEVGIHNTSQDFAKNQDKGYVPIPDELQKAIPAFVQDDYHPTQQTVGLPAIQMNRFGFVIDIVEPMNAYKLQYEHFLDKYGYSNPSVKVPSVYSYIQNTNDDNACTFNTENETFVKTKDCCVTGPNVSVVSNIEQMFNNGHWFIKGDS